MKNERAVKSDFGESGPTLDKRRDGGEREVSRSMIFAKHVFVRMSRVSFSGGCDVLLRLSLVAVVLGSRCILFVSVRIVTDGWKKSWLITLICRERRMTDAKLIAKLQL